MGHFIEDEYYGYCKDCEKLSPNTSRCVSCEEDFCGCCGELENGKCRDCIKEANTNDR